MALAPRFGIDLLVNTEGETYNFLMDHPWRLYMAWQMDGTMLELCSCKAMCPCWLGPDEKPDQGWCAGAIVVDIGKGSIDGVDVSGCRAALAVRWPGNFFAGSGTARVYVDSGATEAQRSALEAVVSGQKGGMFGAVIGPAVTQWLPAQAAAIKLTRSEGWSVSIGDLTQLTLTPYKNFSGHPATVSGTAAQEAFQSKSMELMSARGSRWNDADLPAWEGDSGTAHTVSWAG